MGYHSYLEACSECNKYRNLKGVIPDGYKTPIRLIFVGIEDEFMNRQILSGIKGTFHEHQFTASDLSIAGCWVNFADDTIVRINEIMKDKEMQDLCKTADALIHEIVVTENYTTPIQIPKGLHIRIVIKDDTDMEIYIQDKSEPKQKYQNTIQRYSNGFYNIFYNELQVGLDKMIKPEISFRLSTNDIAPKNIRVIFTDTISADIR